jgi:hypothetical protein
MLTALLGYGSAFQAAGLLLHLTSLVVILLVPLFPRPQTAAAQGSSALI